MMNLKTLLKVEWEFMLDFISAEMDLLELDSEV